MTTRYKSVELRFFGDLVDFLPGRRPVVERTFDVAPSIKDSIEASGVPHTEVDLILADGVPVGWEHPLRDGERITVYPRFRSFDVSGFSLVHVAPLEAPRFVVDGHLARLARYLRLLGFDSLQPAGADDEDLAKLSAGQSRAVLTRDLGLLKRSIVRHGYFVRSVDPLLQCAEVVRHFDLIEVAAPYTRCMACNGRLEPLGNDEASHEVPTRIAARHDSFQRCTDCDRVYWEGSHVARLDEIVAAVRALAQARR